jgi:hypothetical protein
MADEKAPDIRDLANRWAIKARDSARDSKDPSLTEAQAQYRRGVADGYYRAATELAEFIKSQNIVSVPGAAASSTAASSSASLPPARPTMPGARAAAAAAPPAPPKPQYVQVSISEVLSILESCRTNVRDIKENADYTYSLVFSKWEPIMPHERIERLKAADLRIVILESGKVKDTNDPYIELAFRPV